MAATFWDQKNKRIKVESFGEGRVKLSIRRYNANDLTASREEILQASNAGPYKLLVDIQEAEQNGIVISYEDCKLFADNIRSGAAFPKAVAVLGEAPSMTYMLLKDILHYTGERNFPLEYFSNAGAAADWLSSDNHIDL